MGRRQDHTRDELHEMFLVAAQEIAAREGLRGLTARRVAERIGYSSGTLYNVYESRNELVVQMNGRTLDALYDALATDELDNDPKTALRSLADRYIRFTAEHANLWNVLFEPSLPHGDELPDWHHEKVERLLALVERALAPLFAPNGKDDRRHSARVLWSALHGICSLANAGALAKSESATKMANSLITNYVAGLGGAHD